MAKRDLKRKKGQIVELTPDTALKPRNVTDPISYEGNSTMAQLILILMIAKIVNGRHTIGQFYHDLWSPQPNSK